MIFATLVLFAAFYNMAWRDRRQRAQHKRWMIVASAAGMGAAMFRIFMVTFGPQDWVVPASILVTNLFITAGMLVDRARGLPLASSYLIGLLACASVEFGVYILTPTPPGQGLMHALAWVGQSFQILY
jgi:ABC-type Fe3+-siderophore transport system permease subunit